MRNLARARRRSPLFDRVVATTGACTLLFGLTATAADASTLRPQLSGKLTMNVFTFTTPVMQPVIAAFEKLYPNVHIEAANVVNTPSTYVPLLQTERLAGNEPMIDETYDVLTPTLEVDGLLRRPNRRPEGRAAVPAELLAADVRGLVHPADRCPLRRRSGFRLGQRGRCDRHHVQRERVQKGRRAISRRTAGRGRKCWPMRQN